MPIHIVKSPDVVLPRGELVVPKGKVRFIDFEFRGIARVLGIQCDEKDQGGTVCDFLESNRDPTPAQNLTQLQREEMFKYALGHETIPANGELELQLAFKNIVTLVTVTIRHREAENSGDEPLEAAA